MAPRKKGTRTHKEVVAGVKPEEKQVSEVEESKKEVAETPAIDTPEVEKPPKEVVEAKPEEEIVEEQVAEPVEAADEEKPASNREFAAERIKEKKEAENNTVDVLQNQIQMLQNQMMMMAQQQQPQQVQPEPEKPVNPLEGVDFVMDDPEEVNRKLMEGIEQRATQIAEDRTKELSTQFQEMQIASDYNNWNQEVLAMPELTQSKVNFVRDALRQQLAVKYPQATAQQIEVEIRNAELYDVNNVVKTNAAHFGMTVEQATEAYVNNLATQFGYEPPLQQTAPSPVNVEAERERAGLGGMAGTVSSHKPAAGSKKPSTQLQRMKEQGHKPIGNPRRATEFYQAFTLVLFMLY